MTDCEIIQGESQLIIPEIIVPGSVNCVVEDPPYGADFVSRRAATPEGKKYVQAIEGDKDLDGALHLFHDVNDALLPLCSPTCELYVFTRWDIVDVWMQAVRSLERHGFSYKMLLIWDKGIPGMGDIDANWGCGHELILYCKRGRRDVAHRRSGIIHVDKLGSREHIHPTEKPARLIEHLIAMSTEPGDLVVDPFAGSGSSIVAAQNLGRRGIGIEKNPDYARAAAGRLSQTAAFG